MLSSTKTDRRRRKWRQIISCINRNKTTEHFRRNYSQKQLMAHWKFATISLLLRESSTSLNEAEKAPIFCLLHHSQVPHVYTEPFYLQKRWIMLSPTPASLSWKRGLTDSIRLAGELCVKYPCEGPHIRTQEHNTYMCVKYLRGSNIRRCMFSISIPSMLLENKRNVTLHMYWQGKKQ